MPRNSGRRALPVPSLATAFKIVIGGKVYAVEKGCTVKMDEQRRQG
jgi:hypothetical protein